MSRHADGRPAKDGPAGKSDIRGRGADVSSLPRTADETAQLRNLVVLASHLADDIASRSERERTIFDQAWYAGYRTGFAAGQHVGYARCEASYAESWRPIAEHVRNLGPSHAELEVRRWGPGGRERFGDNWLPGDFPGVAHERRCVCCDATPPDHLDPGDECPTCFATLPVNMPPGRHS